MAGSETRGELLANPGAKPRAVARRIAWIEVAGLPATLI